MEAKEAVILPKIIRKVETTIPSLPQRKRVAAYARVSSGKDAMLHSLSAQVSYYSNLIQRNPEWCYAGVYIDEALTGTKDNRKDFQRLLEDCRAGKIDRVLTKSISRFARNTVTLLETVRELKALGVDVYFEEQNIHSMNGDGELMLTILASYAQEESLSVSENCKWRIRNQFKSGELVNWHSMYGYRIRRKGITIQPEEAQVVREVFGRYLEGDTVADISKWMREQGMAGPRNGIWTPKRVIEMLKNEKYAGNALLQKKYVVDHLSKKEKRNHGELPKYYAEGTHPAIISPETFRRVQEQLEQNRVKNGIQQIAPAHNLFTGMLVCGQCGKKYKRKTNHGRPIWNCTTYLTLGKSHCYAKLVPEDILMETTALVLGMPNFDEEILRDQIERIEVPRFNHLVYVFKDGRQEERVWQDKSRRDSWTAEMKRNASDCAKRRKTK